MLRISLGALWPSDAGLSAECAWRAPTGMLHPNLGQGAMGDLQVSSHARHALLTGLRLKKGRKVGQYGSVDGIGR